MFLLYFMDGVKIEMVDKHMPFLADMNKVPMKSVFGYSCACHATMYTSRFIEEHNTWFVWKRGDNSPYKWIDRVPFLTKFNCIPVKAIIAKVTRKLKRNRSFPGIPMMVNLPLKYWSLFETCEEEFWTDNKYMSDYDTIFKILKKENIKHHIVALSKGGDVYTEEAQVDYNNNDFVYYFIGETDSYMHKYGEKSPISIDYFKKVDNFIKTTYEKACSASDDDVTIVCYSDHGHIDVEKKIDINDYFKPEGLNINRYIHLIESTFARFWVRNEKERMDIIKVLKKLEDKKMGFSLTKEYKSEYHLNFKSNEHGDIIFHLSSPNIFTNTIWGFGKTIKSMHGYEPTQPKHFGVFASNKKVVDNREFAYLVDILPTVLNELGLDTSKYTMRGRNILK
jgi:hypothetical protein